MPFFSCILLSHDKPDHVGEAIDSLLAQTFRDWEAIVFDSGVLYDRGCFAALPALQDPRFRVIRSWETKEIRQTKTVASWCFNECFRRQLLRGRFVTYLCDDDLYYPNAFEAFHDYLRSNPAAQAVYAAVDMTAVSASGEKMVLRESPAREVKGRCYDGGPLDGHVDYLQLCHEAALFQRFADDEFWPEDRAVMRHADGILLEKIGNLAPIYPVPAKIGENRKVPSSLNTGGGVLELLMEVCRRDREIARLQQIIAELDRVPLSLRYRIADRVNDAAKRLPGLHRLGKKLARLCRSAVRA